MAGGYLWTLVAVNVITSLIIGYFAGIIAMARSRDAFGHGRNAFLAFIPLANFVLLLKVSKNEISAYRIPTIPLMTGGLGVLTGFFLIAAASVLTATLEMQVNKIVERAIFDPSFVGVAVEFLIRSEGLETALSQMASEIAVPEKIDEVTTLVEIETNATTLRYRYTINNANADYLLDSFRQRLTENTCANMAIRPVLQAGGVIEQAYYKLDGREIGTVEIAAEQCGF